MKILKRWLKLKGESMYVKAFTPNSGSMELKVDTYKEAMEYITQLRKDGFTINEYTIVFNKEAVDLYEKPFQDLIDNTFDMHYSIFEMERTTEGLWH